MIAVLSSSSLSAFLVFFLCFPQSHVLAAVPLPWAAQSRSAPLSPRTQSSADAAGSTVEATLQAQLDAVVAAGLLQREDFNERIMAALRSMPVCASIILSTVEPR